MLGLDRGVVTLYANDDMSTPFGRKIKERRHRLDLSLRKVCEAVHNEDGKSISVSYLNDIEQGHRNPPGGKIIVQLAEVLQFNVQELLKLAGKADPVIEKAVERNAKVGVLFRRIAQQLESDPGVVDRLSKEIDKKT